MCTYENEELWSNAEILNLQSVFRPTCAANASAGVQLMHLSHSNFAVRGGGHMAIKAL